MIHIRKAVAEDQECIWQIIRQVISGRDSHVFDPCSSRQDTYVDACIMWRKL